MKKLVAAALLFLTLAPFGFAVLPPQTQYNMTDPSFQRQREQELGAIVQAEGERTRNYMTDFGQKMQEQFDRKEDEVKRTIDVMLMKFKFTLPLVVFCGMLAALELHDFFHYRRERRYKDHLKVEPLTFEKADAIKRQSLDRPSQTIKNPANVPKVAQQAAPELPAYPLTPDGAGVPSQEELLRFYYSGGKVAPKAPLTETQRLRVAVYVLLLGLVVVGGFALAYSIGWLHA